MYVFMRMCCMMLMRWGGRCYYYYWYHYNTVTPLHLHLVSSWDKCDTGHQDPGGVTNIYTIIHQIFMLLDYKIKLNNLQREAFKKVIFFILVADIRLSAKKVWLLVWFCSKCPLFFSLHAIFNVHIWAIWTLICT